LAEALAAGTVDAAVSWGLGLPAGLSRVELARIGPHALLSETHFLTAKPALTLADLGGQPLVLTDQDLSIAHLQVLFHRAGVECHIAHRCATLDLMRSFAANGLGIGLSYTQPAPRISHDGRPLILRRVLDAGTEPVVLARPTNAPEPAGVAEISRFLSKLMTSRTNPSLKAL
jgi:DNA-binding transcriptional LysR family regulator